VIFVKITGQHRGLKYELASAQLEMKHVDDLIRLSHPKE
jgi:hypothetical protein